MLISGKIDKRLIGLILDVLEDEMNFPNQSDLVFWQSKTEPQWVSRIKKKPWPVRDTSVLIDQCVNSHGQVKHSSAGQVAAHNLMVFIKGWSRRGEDVEAQLLELSIHPECMISPEKRAAFAKKWLRRLTEV